MNILYKIEFFSDWHCGSGLTAGADLDVLVIKNSDNLPYVPGKTIKGLLREAVENLQQFDNNYKDLNINEVFDYKEGKNQMESAFFTNAELQKKQREAIISNNVAKYLYRTIASTAIDDNGIAKNHSLRKMEVVIPCILEGEIMNIPEDMKQLIFNGLRYIKRLGQNRNRGLGRCQISILEENTL